MKNENQLYYNYDQELLFKAFAHHAVNITRKSRNLVIGLIRVCINEVSERSNVNIADTKQLNDAKRKELLEHGIDEFIKRARVGSVHRKEIKSGCLSIYDRWCELKASIRNERDLLLEEIISDTGSNLIGYEDQEVLMNAFTHYITNVTGFEKNRVIKLIRVCMLEITIPRRVNLKESRYLDEETREEMITAGIDEYIRRMKITGNNAAIIKADCMKVYSRWKEIRRVDPEKDNIEFNELIGTV